MPGKFCSLRPEDMEAAYPALAKVSSRVDGLYQRFHSAPIRNLKWAAALTDLAKKQFTRKEHEKNGDSRAV